MRYVGLLTLLLAACAPQSTDWAMAGVAPTQLQQDFAECRIQATDVASGYGGFAALAARDQTLNDCMTAKGYSR